MAALSDLYIKKETLQTLIDVLNKKGEKGISITISTNDDSNQWGQNVAAYVSQTKEQREAKKEKFYIGNGRVFWNDGKIVNGEKPTESAQTDVTDNGDDGDLPF